MAAVSRRQRPDSLTYATVSDDATRQRARPGSLTGSLTGSPPPTDTRLPPDGHEFPPDFRLCEQGSPPGDPTEITVSVYTGKELGPGEALKECQTRGMLVEEPGLFFAAEPSRKGCQKPGPMVERDGGGLGDFRTKHLGEHDLRKSKSGTSVRDRIALFSSSSKESLSGSRTRLAPHSGTDRDTLGGARLGQGRAQERSKSDLKLTGNETQRCRSRDDVVRRKKISDPSGEKYGSLVSVHARDKSGDNSPGTDSSSCSSRSSLPMPPSHSRDSSTGRSESSGDGDGDECSSPLAERSQSLFDLGHTEKRHSYAGMHSKGYGYQGSPSDLPRKTSLNSIMEERRKSFSKLRGLIIPSKVDVTKKGPADMPAIKSKDLRVLTRPSPRLLSPVPSPAPARSRLSTPERLERPEPRHLTSPPWKGDTSSTLPMYSPAFKRKNVSVYSSPSSAFRSVSSSSRLGGSSIELSRASPHDSPSRRQESRCARAGLQRTTPVKEPLQRSSSLNSRPPAGAGEGRRRVSDDVGPMEGRRLPAHLQLADGDADVGSSTLTLVDEPLEEEEAAPRSQRSRAGSLDFDHRASTSTLLASPVKEIDVEEEFGGAGRETRAEAALQAVTMRRSPSLKVPSAQEKTERISGSPPKIQEDAAWRKFASPTDSSGLSPTSGESRDLSKLRQSTKPSVKSLKERWQMMSDTSDTACPVSRSPSLRSERPEIMSRESASRESVSRDSVSRESVSRDSVSRESVSRDSVSRESVSYDSVFRESVSRESFSLESVSRESAPYESSVPAEQTPSPSPTKDTSTSVREVVDRNWPSIESERADIDRKLSTPSYGGAAPARMRDRRGRLPSRPQSWVESERELRVFETGSLLGGNTVSTSTISTSSSQENIMDAFDCGKSPSGSTSSLLEMLTANLKRTARSRHVLSVSDLRRAFERSDGRTCHARVSSLDSNGSEDSPGAAIMAGSTRDHYGSITSLASSTSLISPHELQQLIEEANQSLEEAGTPSHEIIVAVVHREVMGGSIGITLAGGADYENKEISVNKVITGSVADRDGRIKKGDRVISINGRSMKNTTHREALNTLKAPRAEVVLVLSRSRSVTPLDVTPDEMGYHRPSVINTFSSRPPKILESPMDSKSLASDLAFEDVPRGPPSVVTLFKEGAGVGFSLEGGKDSPLGDRPLVAKKIFTGGAADKSGKLHVGDQILAINDEDVTHMPRIEAWNFLKKQAEGALRLTIRKRLAPGEAPAPSVMKPTMVLPPGGSSGRREGAPPADSGSRESSRAGPRPVISAVTPNVPLQSPEVILPKA